ncbi:hypothetical protein B0H14DRAFT_3461074 [Mycena olivaceomarginata]|nr:hypothetical protein B0H14DRAFT_3461074 [Mycena olivaceomarginata]
MISTRFDASFDRLSLAYTAAVDRSTSSRYPAILWHSYPSQSCSTAIPKAGAESGLYFSLSSPAEIKFAQPALSSWALQLVRTTLPACLDKWAC